MSLLEESHAVAVTCISNYGYSYLNDMPLVVSQIVKVVQHSLRFNYQGKSSVTLLNVFRAPKQSHYGNTGYCSLAVCMNWFEQICLKTVWENIYCFHILLEVWFIIHLILRYATQNPIQMETVIMLWCINCSFTHSVTVCIPHQHMHTNIIFRWSA